MFYEQVEGEAMGCPVSPIVADVYMDHFEKKVCSTTFTPRLWIRYVDDTFVIQLEGKMQTFLEHTNKVYPAIKFTVEGYQENGAIPFLDTFVIPEADNTLSITVYRKPAHTDQYLQWDSHHNLAAKHSMISNLTHRARTVFTKSELLNKELQHLKKALTKCKYPKCALDKVERKFTNISQENSNVEPREEDCDSPSGSTTGRDPGKDKYKKGLYTLYTGTRREHQEDIWEVWHPDPLQG